MTAFSIEIV